MRLRKADQADDRDRPVDRREIAVHAHDQFDVRGLGTDIHPLYGEVLLQPGDGIDRSCIQAEAGIGPFTVVLRALPAERWDRAAVTEILEGLDQADVGEGAIARKGRSWCHGGDDQIDMGAFLGAPITPCQAAIDLVALADLEFLGRRLREHDAVYAVWQGAVGRQQRIAATGGDQLGRHDARRLRAVQFDRGCDTAGTGDDEGHIAAALHGAKPVQVEAPAADRTDLAIFGVLDELIEHAADDTELETEQHQHRPKHRGQGQHETAGHLPLVGIVARCESQGLEQAHGAFNR